MAITKTGGRLISSGLIGGASKLLSRLSRRSGRFRAKGKKPGFLSKAFDTVSTAAFPIFTFGWPLYSFMSGNESLGGAFGDSLGSSGAWLLADRLMRKRFPGGGFLRGAANIGVPMVASMAGASIGRRIGEKIAPYKRPDPNINAFRQRQFQQWDAALHNNGYY